jgi:thioredoxin-dependent peroxiredoxin
MKLEPGDLAPAFEAVDQDGRPVRSTDLAGKRFVLWFYPMADTPG